MSLLNKLFKKTEEKKPAREKKVSAKTKETTKPVAIDVEKPNVQNKTAVFSAKGGSASGGKSDGILIAPHTAEKALTAQKNNQYVFKVSPRANKIEIKKAVGRAYKVKAVSVNIINIPGRTRRVGKTTGWKSGYKKAIVTLASGQSIEIK